MKVNSSDDTLAAKFELNFNGQTFTLQKGDFVLVVGKSGSGKTALLLQMEEQLKALGQTTGFVFQNFDSQIVTDKVWHELSFALENTGVGRELMERRVGEMAAYFGISSWLGCKTENLSGGQKQLLNLAGTMALNPQFLLLDEPVSQLDPIAASNFLNTVKKLNRELGLTVVICEHRVEDIFSEADRVIFLDKMNIFFDGEPRGLCRKVLACKRRDLIDFLPEAARIFARLGNFFADGDKEQKEKASEIADIPISVGEGRRWLFEKKDELKFRFKGADCFVGAKTAVLPGNLPDKVQKNAILSEKKCFKSWEKIKEKPLVSIHNLGFRYEKNSPWILQELNFNLKPSNIYAVVGANGSGKTTLLKILCSLLKPSCGSVKFQKKSSSGTGEAGKTKKQDGEKKEGGEKKLKVCLLSQNVRNLFVKPTVLEELEDSGWKKDKKSTAYGRDFSSDGAALLTGDLPSDGATAPLTGDLPSDGVCAPLTGDSLSESVCAPLTGDSLSDGAAAPSTEEILQKIILSLEGCFLRHPYDLSGGEMQKLALAKILLQKPDILLLDEPTKALDCGFKKELSLLLKKLAKRGMTVVLVCHDLEFCSSTADFTAMMFEGQLVGLDKTADFFEKNIFYTTAAGRIFRGFEEEFSSAAGSWEALKKLIKGNRGLVEGEER